MQSLVYFCCLVYRRKQRASPLLLVSAAVALFCLGAVVHYHASGSASISSLVSMGDLGKEAKQFQNMEASVRHEMDMNDHLEGQYDNVVKQNLRKVEEDGGGSAEDNKACHCHCHDASPELKANVATMLTQIGEVSAAGSRKPMSTRLRAGATPSCWHDLAMHLHL